MAEPEVYKVAPNTDLCPSSVRSSGCGFESQILPDYDLWFVSTMGFNNWYLPHFGISEHLKLTQYDETEILGKVTLSLTLHINFYKGNILFVLVVNMIVPMYP